jgi:AcrR family transcriptional regulator
VEDRGYHHGQLRAVLLDEAERALREHGADKVSLRDLARQAGVSHAAPRRHFADRQALLDALAEAGFARLTDEVRAAADGAGNAQRKRLLAVAKAFVHFAIDNAALLDLMFATKNGEPPATLRESAAQLFTTIGAVIREAQEAGTLPARDPERTQLLFAAVLQGIATLVTSGRARPDQADPLVADAVEQLLA